MQGKIIFIKCDLGRGILKVKAKSEFILLPPRGMLEKFQNKYTRKLAILQFNQKS